MAHTQAAQSCHQADRVQQRRWLLLTACVQLNAGGWHYPNLPGLLVLSVLHFLAG